MIKCLTWTFPGLASGLTLCDLCNCPGQADFTTPVFCSNCQGQPHLAPLSWKPALADTARCHPADAHVCLDDFPFASLSFAASS